MPELPSSMMEAAISVHEFFRSFMEAGFTEDQALKLCGMIINKDPDDAGTS